MKSATPIIACAADFDHMGGYYATLARQVQDRGLRFHNAGLNPFSWAGLMCPRFASFKRIG